MHTLVAIFQWFKHELDCLDEYGQWMLDTVLTPEDFMSIAAERWLDEQNMK